MKKSLTLFSLLAITTIAQADPTTSLLASLSNAPGATGFEAPVRKILLPIWQQNLSTIKVDGLGNMLGTVTNGKSSPNILLMSHMDEVGLILRDITENGFIQVEPLGGFHGPIAQRWVITTKQGSVVGYSGTESGHMVPHSDQTSKPVDTATPLPREIFIDVGAENKTDALNRLGLRPGLPITPDTTFAALNNSNEYLGKAFDDRAGLALITLAAEQARQSNHPNQLSLAATVQEEVGLRGAQVIYNQIKPDVVINLEVCVAGDFPLRTAATQASYPALGKGPCLYVYDKSMIPNPNLVDWVANLAKENNIPFQYAAGLNYGQDGASLQLSGSGVPVINIGIPLRYAHQQAGVINRADFDATLKLVNAIVKKFDDKQLKIVTET